MLALVTGAVRSGKSTFALQLARGDGRTPVFLATAEVDPADPEMTARVARHRRDRGALRTVEVDERGGPGLIAAIAAGRTDEVLVLDALGTWFGALLLGCEEAAGCAPLEAAEELERRAAELLPALQAARAGVVVVAEQAGAGVVPQSPLGRIFRDQLGRTTAEIARAADRAYLVVAGFAVDLRAVGVPVGP